MLSRCTIFVGGRQTRAGLTATTTITTTTTTMTANGFCWRRRYCWPTGRPLPLPPPESARFVCARRQGYSQFPVEEPRTTPTDVGGGRRRRHRRYSSRSASLARSVSVRGGKGGRAGAACAGRVHPTRNHRPPCIASIERPLRP